MINLADDGRIRSSFRDPDGFLFKRDDILYRQINMSYKENYDLLISSGLYDLLVDEKLLTPHEETGIRPALPEKAYKIIKPRPVKFISYPYEWCFSQLRDAALTTLKIESLALEHGMSLKDCSAYNIQYHAGCPVFIDTLSFEKYNEGTPWTAYSQFCRHFLAPLALMGRRDIRLGQLMKSNIDGIPLDLASRLLPRRTRLRWGMLLHIHLHSKSRQYYAGKNVGKESCIGKEVGRTAMLGLIDSLSSAVKKIKWNRTQTEWSDYRGTMSYPETAIRHKKEIILKMLDDIRPEHLWDIGANTGEFSRIAAGKGIDIVSIDADPGAVEKNYIDCKERNETSILPLLMDITNPSPAVGWDNKERMSLIERGPADTALALALVHHLAISNNIPFENIAGFFSEIAKSLIIEFIPKDDPQVEGLLRFRKDVFSEYTKRNFETAFRKHFTEKRSELVRETGRIIYYYERNTSQL